ncbi:K Homology domain type 1 [Penicillium cf. griseofulvum]|uniref:K Homology domain type 1 n=1 Tax=Penicillium cf. griseofulvum TaxID=2972120 RepID=A0A9W9JFD8_9EURO|nr:K Homology domain type 1 [Penicillium cf. griseofulvum]KAJ5445214.1 K Homology domain type 1 [Penicillium cf. griseofulvum]KAJ5446938.1 K Homology domain type 1 [Penicillium cf. griseofulvum]
MADDEHRVKRSRFDQTEPEPRRSRFDRRSRSPSNRQSESARTRSPLSRPLSGSPGADAPAKPSAVDPAAAAAAAAAKINAQLQAKKGIQHVDVPPIRSADNATENSQSPSAEGAAKLNAEIYVADGDYIKDIEINDLRNRYTLTKGSTQKMIQDETGADVTTRGNYYPDKNMATAASPPLYLHVTSTNKEGLEKAVAMINDLMQKELPNLVDERRFRRREPEQQVERDEYGRRKWPDERIPIDLEPIPGFNLRAQVVGQGGAYVKHIQQQTRCRVQIKGRGSGFIESSTGRESDEPMFLHVAGPDANDVQQAKELCEDLLTNVKEQYQRFKENPPQHNYGGYGNRGGDRGDRGDRYQGGGGGGYGGGYNNRQQHNPSSASPAGQAAAAVASPGAAATPTAADYGAQYAQYYGSADPYAAYGGYQNYVAYYQYYQQMAAAQQQADGTAPAAPASEAPPPPPGSGSPPPPPPGAGGGGYSAVPPPPGL